MRIPILLLILLLSAVAPAAAQQTPDPAANADTAQTETDIKSLIRILEDDKARSRLIENLRAAAAGTPADPATAPAETVDQTVALRIADFTRTAAERGAHIFGTMTDLVRQAAHVSTHAAMADIWAIWNVIRNVALVVIVTFAAFLVLQLVYVRRQHVLAEAATQSGALRRVGFVALSAVIDAATVLAAWGIGHAFALNIDRLGQIGINRSLFLNAFLIVELVKVGARVLLEPRWSALRISGLDDQSAAYWYFWLSRLISIVGYTFLFVVPIIAANVSQTVADDISIAVMFATLVLASVIVLQNRATVREHLRSSARNGTANVLSRSLGAIASVWHIIVIAYLTLVFALWLADHSALPHILWATLQSLIAIALGMALVAFIARLLSGGMRLPPDTRERLPFLETRLNSLAPNFLRAARIIVAIAVALVIAQAWRLIDLGAWLSTGIGQQLATSLASVFIILLIGGLIYFAVESWVEYRLNPNVGTVPTARERTLLSLFRNAFTIALAVIVFMLVVSELGVHIGPLLAGAGVVGLAVGFGAQKLVQDVITGAFIQFENAMNEGDVVTAGGVTGVVERLTIRSVSLRTLDGAYHLIPFSSVDAVSNFMKYFSYHVAAIGVAYRESIPEVKRAMQDAFDRLKQSDFGEYIIGDLEMHGVVEFSESAIIVRARIKTMAGQQWAVGRAYNELLKDVFDERGIEIPFPHVTVYMGEDKQGNAPPLRIKPASADKSSTDATPGLSDTATTEGAEKPRKRRKSRVTQDAPPDEGGSPDEAV